MSSPADPVRVSPGADARPARRARALLGSGPILNRGLFRLALRNLLRHRVRSAVTLAAVAFGVIGLILTGGFVQNMVRQLGETLIHSQTGHAQVGREGYFEFGRRVPERYLMEQHEAVRQQLQTLPGVEAMLARLGFAGLLNNGRTDLAILGEGIEPGPEARLGSALTMLDGRALTDADREAMLIGRGVASALQLKVGDRLTLLVNTPEGALNTIELEVVGIFQSFSKEYDERAVRVPLAAAQELLGTPSVSVLVAHLRDTAFTDAFLQAARARLPGGLEQRSWIELNDFYGKTVELYERQFGVLRLIILLMVFLSVINTVNMSVFERVGEFGTLRALGNRNLQVFALIVIESVMLGAAGAVVGAALGAGLALGISAVGIPMPPPPGSDTGFMGGIDLDALTLAASAGIGLVAASLASLFPAQRAARMPIVDALRSNI